MRQDGWLVGTVAAPSRYDRSALEDTRQALRCLAGEERRREETRLAANANWLLQGVAALQIALILLALGTFVGRALLAEWRPEAPLYALVALAALFLISAFWLPLSARWHAARFARRWRFAQDRALELLNDGAAIQLEYGLQLRHDVLLPLTRLWETHSTNQQQQRGSLHRIVSQISELEGAIHDLGRPTFRERLGLRRSSSTTTKADEEKTLSLPSEAVTGGNPPAKSEARDG